MGLGDNGPLRNAEDYRVARKEITFDGTAGKGLVGSNVVWFTVTGMVEIQWCIGQVGAVQLNSLGGPPGTGTLNLGFISNPGAFVGNTTVNGTTNFVVGAIWVSITPTLFSVAQLTGMKFGFSNGQNVISVVNTNNVIAGVLTMICRWKPFSDGGLLVPA